jgi:hypothetical protein
MQLDEETAGVVLRPLDQDPHTPSTIDVRRAVSEGRRRRRVRRAGAYAATAGVTALALAGGTIVAGNWRSADKPVQPGGSASAPVQTTAPPPAAPTQCKLAQLPLPDGRIMALVTAGDPTGRFLAGRTYPAKGGQDGSMGLHLVIWDRLRPTQVTMPGDDQSFQDINSHGVAVGSGWIGNSTTSFFYRDGKVGKLPDGDASEVRAINDAGAVVGTKADKPIIWRTVDQSPAVLALPSGVSVGKAFDIDEDGTVIGAVGPTDQPYVWAPDGTGRALPVPSPPPPSSSTDPGAQAAGKKAKGGNPALLFNIRDGWVTGRVGDTAMLWNLRTGAVTQVPEIDVRADAVNKYGWQVGLTRQGKAILRSDAGPVALPELYPHPGGTLTNIPNTISDDGTVIGGQSDDRSDTIRAVVWTCS